MKKFYKIYLWFIILLLYLPIAVLILFSFNSEKSFVFMGFSLKWYGELFKNELLMDSLVNTLQIAALASLISTVLGTMAAIGLKNLKGYKRRFALQVSNISIINPEIVTAISLGILFFAVSSKLGFEMGFWTVLLAHISFCVPYVILNVLPKLRQMDKHIYEAALDLGCPPGRAFFKVVVPEIFPGILSGFLISFSFSIDDFVITYFTRGSGFETLPIQIYSILQRRTNPSLNALSALLFLATLIILIALNIADMKSEKAKKVVNF